MNEHANKAYMRWKMIPSTEEEREIINQDGGWMQRATFIAGWTACAEFMPDKLKWAKEGGDDGSRD